MSSIHSPTLAREELSSDALRGPRGEPMHVSVQYYGVTPEESIDALRAQYGDVTQIPATDMQKIRVSRIDDIEEPFILSDIRTVAELDTLLVSKGVSDEIRRDIHAIVCRGENAPKFEFIGDEFMGKFGVVVSTEAPEKSEDTYLSAALERVKEWQSQR